MHDLRYAFRLIRQNWGFSLTVIASSPSASGANTAVLAVVNGAMLRPLPYPEPDRLTEIVAKYKFEGKEGTANNFDGTTWEAIRDHASSLESAVYSDGASRYQSRGERQRRLCEAAAGVRGIFRRARRPAADWARVYCRRGSAQGSTRRDFEPRALAEVFPRRSERDWPGHLAARRALHGGRDHAGRLYLRLEGGYLDGHSALPHRRRRRVEL